MQSLCEGEGSSGVLCSIQGEENMAHLVIRPFMLLSCRKTLYEQILFCTKGLYMENKTTDNAHCEQVD